MAVRLLAILAGYVPWKGWEVCGGYLFPPGWRRNGVLPGEFYGVIYYRQLARDSRLKIQALEEENAQLKGQLARADTAGEAAEPVRRHSRRRRLSPGRPL